MKKIIFFLLLVSFLFLGCTTTYKFDVLQSDNSEIIYDRGIAFNTLETEKFDYQIFGEYFYDDDVLRFYLSILNKTDNSINFFENDIKVSYSTDLNSNNWIDLNYVLPSAYKKTQTKINKARNILDFVSIGYSIVDDSSSFSINTLGSLPERNWEANSEDLLLTSTIKPKTNYDGIFFVNNNLLKNGKRISELVPIYVKVDVKLDGDISSFYFTLNKIEE